MLQDVRDATDSQGTKALQKMSILVSALLARQVICRSPRASLSSGLRTEKLLLRKAGNTLNALGHKTIILLFDLLSIALCQTFEA